jgi:rhodanese-related sulfurtransferase
MPRAINVSEVRQLLADGAQLVDVLSGREYAADHLPGAINIPLTTLDRNTAAQLKRDQAVIVYCHDHQ